MPQLSEQEIGLQLTPPELHDQYLRLVMDGYIRAKRYAQPYLDAHQGWYDLWRGYYTATEEAGWSNVHIPMPFGVVESDVARLLDVVFPQQANYPSMQFIPSGPEDDASARRAERLYDVQSDDMKLRLKAERLIRRANIYGKGMARLGWRRSYGPLNREFAVNFEREIRLKHTAPTIMRFDGPDLTLIANSEGIPTPGFSDIDEMPAFYHVYYREWEEILVRASRSDNGDLPTYDPVAVKALEQSVGAPPKVDTDIRVKRTVEANEDPLTAAIAMMDRPVQLIDAFVSVPRQLGAWYDPDSGLFSREQFGGPKAFYSTEFVITLGNQMHVLRAVPLWTLTQERPIFAYGPTDDPEVFWGPGKLEIIAKLALAMDRLVNDQLDAYTRWIDPPWIINVNSPIVPGTLHAGAGARIWTEGPTTEDDIRQLQPNLQGVRDAFAESGFLWQWAQRATADVEDISMGISSKGRQSATEFAGRSNAVSVRIAAEAARFEKLFLEPCAIHAFDLDRQFLPLPQLLRKIGAHAAWDPIAGRFQSPQLDVITDFDMAKSFDIRATGATRQLTKFARQQQIMALLPTLVPFMQGLNILELLREVMTVMDFRNVDRIVLSEQQMLQSLIVASQMAAQGMATTGQSAGVSGQGGQPGGGGGSAAGGDRNRSRVSATRPPDGGIGQAAQDPLGNLRGQMIGAPVSP